MAKRILIVCDGEDWLIRRVACTVEDSIRGEMVYHCDKGLGMPGGGPFKSLTAAVAVARKEMKPRKRKTTSSR